MTGFLTVMLCLGVAAVFFHLLYSVDTRRIDKSEKKRDLENGVSKDYGDPKKVYGKNWDSNLPKPRICPVCGKYLQKQNIYTPSFRNLLLPVSKDTLEFTAVDIVILD